MNHKGQLCQDECDLGICSHAGKYLTHEHWSCCGHKRHEPCICPAVPAPPSKKDDSPGVESLLEEGMNQKVSRDVARLVVSPETCGFPGDTFEEMKQFFLVIFRFNHVCFCHMECDCSQMCTVVLCIFSFDILNRQPSTISLLSRT